MSKEVENPDSNISKPKPLIQSVSHRPVSTGYNYENTDNLKFEAKPDTQLRLNLQAKPYAPKKNTNTTITNNNNPLAQSQDISSFRQQNPSNRSMQTNYYMNYSNQSYYTNYNNRYPQNNAFTMNTNDYSYNLKNSQNFNPNYQNNNQSFNLNYHNSNKRSLLDSKAPMFFPKDKKNYTELNKFRTEPNRTL